MSSAQQCPGEEVLAEFAAGALAGVDVAAVEDHLDGCVDCAWLVGRLIGDKPAPAGSAAASAPEVRSGKTARYLLREVVGAGGMGTVYDAEDVGLGRRVALKLLREEARDQTGRAARFLREARITAMLEHPNIVPVLEVGELEDGVPYYTQRLVHGRTLAKALAAAPDLAARLSLLPHFLDLCHAIAYAHGKGVIHRDVKPGNVMVGPFGETVVVDWGLARLRGGPKELAATDPALPKLVPGMTIEGQAVGTPGYMSPEQAAGRQDEVDERSDVFSLGAVLFEILVGRPPFTGRSNEEVLRQAISGPMPEARGEGIPPDLAAVAAKALSREPRDRYADAAQMEADVAAWSAGRMVSVYRYSPWQRVSRLAGRHRLATASALLTLLVVGAWLGSVWGQRKELLHQRADELTTRGWRYAGAGQWDRSATYFASARVARDLPEARWGQAAIGASGLVPLYKLRRHTGQVRAVAFSPDGLALASAGDDRTIRVFETANGLERVRFEVGDTVTALQFTSDGKSLVCAVGSSLELWSLERGAREGQLTAGDAVRSVSLSRDGQRVAAAAGKEVLVWDLTTRREVARTTAPAAVDTVALLASGELVFGGLSLAGLQLWNPDRPEVAPATIGPSELHVRRAVSCASPQLFVVDAQSSSFVWTLHGAQPPESALLQAPDCKEIGVSADCRTLVCLGSVGNVRLWDIEARRNFTSLAGSWRQSLSVAVSPDGERFAVGSADHAVRLWAVGGARQHAGHRGAGSRPTALGWSPDGKLLVSTDRSGLLQFWDPATGRAAGEVHAHEGGARALAFSGAGGSWASAGLDGVRLWSAERRPLGRPLTEPTAALAFAPGGGLLAAGGQDGALRLLAPAGGPVETLPAHRREVHALAFSPDGTRLASAGGDGSVLLWDPKQRRLLARLEGHEDEAQTVAFSPDGKLLVSGSADRMLRLWDPADGRPIATLQGEHSGEIDAMAFAPPAKDAPAAGLLFSCTTPVHYELWDVKARTSLMAVPGNSLATVVGVAFPPDARRVALLHSDGVLLFLDLTGIERLQSPQHDLAELMRLYKYRELGDDFIRDEDALRPPAER